MRAILCVLTVVAAGLLVGCSDQNDPTVSNPVQPQVGKPQVLEGFVVDALIVEPSSGDEYHVFGSIEYVYAKAGSDFKFMRHAYLNLENVPKGLTGIILRDSGSKGELKDGEPIIVSDEHSLDSMISGLVLHVNYLVSDVVTLGDLSIEVREIIVTEK
ncbi:MAG: hypothetical protein HW412_2035 [Bacteroidetes bacterium]|nr:hypothetical protein [Bacteroidota bacterium]